MLVYCNLFFMAAQKMSSIVKVLMINKSKNEIWLNVDQLTVLFAAYP